MRTLVTQESTAPMEENRTAVSMATELRVLRLFAVFAAAREPRRLSELAADLKIPTSSCFALVKQLVAEGYLYEVGERGGYYPTERLHQYTRVVSANHPILRHLAGEMEEIRNRTGETVMLGRRDGAHWLCLAVRESLQEIRHTGFTGRRRPLHVGAGGKALLGGCSAEERKEILMTGGVLSGRDLVAMGPNTLPTLEALEEDIRRSEARGWYQSAGEGIPGSAAVAVRLHLAGVTYVVQAAGPADRFDEGRRTSAGPLMADLARRVSATHYGEVAAVAEPPRTRRRAVAPAGGGG
jgi:DNA-binding IclR family transcriptional regulator